MRGDLMQLVGIQTCSGCGGMMAVTVPSEELEAGGESCDLCGASAIVPVWHQAPAEVVALVLFANERNRLNLPPLTGADWQ